MKFQNIVRPDQATARVSKLGCQFQKEEEEGRGRGREGEDDENYYKQNSRT